MSWSFTIPYEDPADDRPLLDRFADAAAKSGMPKAAFNHHLTMVRHILSETGPDEQGLETHFVASGHLNADGTGSYNISVSYEHPVPSLRNTTASIPAFTAADEYGVPVSPEIQAAMDTHAAFPQGDTGDENVDIPTDIPRTPLNYRTPTNLTPPEGQV